MKKGLIFLIGLVSFLGMNTVSADTYISSTYYNGFETYVNDYLKYEENINYMINYWEENYSNEYPYYIVIDINSYFFTLYYSKTNILTYNDGGFSFYNASYGDSGYNVIEYSIASKEYSYSTYTVPIINMVDKGFDILISNGIIYDGLSSNFDSVLIPSYTSDTLNLSIPDIEIKNGSIFPTIMSLYDGSYNTNLTSYTTINLNDYPYVALSLKDYSATETFYTNMYVQGQLCLTPVYNYGMTEKADIISGSKNQRCSIYYENSTLVRTYILDQDIKNNAIYYLKAYDTSKENIVKVDSSVFDITYITEDTKNSPYVSISGKTYPTIAYDNLTDTATKSEDEDYISGVSCQVGDFNCYNEYNPSNIFNDLFDKPLEMLKSVWGAIITIFELIAEFILLLPPTMQGFLYIAFAIAIILGIIKILV